PAPGPGQLRPELRRSLLPRARRQQAPRGLPDGRGGAGAVFTSAPALPLVVLPTYQEAQTIDQVLTASRRELPAAAVLVVDDASPDGTADRAGAMAAQLGQIEVLRRRGKAGLGRSEEHTSELQSRE